MPEKMPEKKIATLCILCEDSKILLGFKKRGFGVGLWNGFGGKVQENESIEEAAKREFSEECGLVADEVEKIGILDFEYIGKDKDAIVHVFKIKKYHGTISESEEMKPQWFHLQEVPFDKMWSDDKYWLPIFLEDKKFEAKFIYEGYSKIIQQELTLL